MESVLSNFLNYLLQVLLATATQLLILLGPLLVLALLMNLVSAQSSKTGIRVFGYKGFLYGFKWIGTPIHELGHAFFALIFGHKINEIKWFDPQGKDGCYGSVSHSHTPGNPYQEIGTFFIGIGPILMCSIILYLVSYFFFGVHVSDLSRASISASSFSGFSSVMSMVSGIASGFQAFLTAVFTGPNTTWWKVLIFIYLLFSVGSSITLSKADLESAVGGFAYTVVLLLIINLLTLWIGNFMAWSMTRASLFFSGFYFIMITSLLLNLLFLILMHVYLLIRNRLISRGGVQ